MSLKPQILILLCNKCKGMTEKLQPEIQLRFAENLRVLPVTCPSQVNPLALVKLLKNSADGVIVACPKDACCCPDNKKVIKRRELVRDILPVFDLHKEQLQVASVSPFGGEELVMVVEQMLAFLKTTKRFMDGYSYQLLEDDIVDGYRWIN